jgi:hypothetical protein
MRSTRYVVAAVAGAGALLVGGGAALASHDGDRTSRCEAAFARIAERRGVTVDELEAQIKQRLLARVDAALAAGRITADQAAKLRQRIADAEPCQRAGHRRGHPGSAHVGLRRAVAAAAHYLGLTNEELRAQLPGTSLGALAEKQGKSVDGLKAALLAPAKQRLANAVSAGRITQTRADAILDRLEAAVDRLVAKTFPKA